jgi:hypothetical protein
VATVESVYPASTRSLEGGFLAPDRNSLQLHAHILMRVMSLTEHFHDNIRRKDTLRHVSVNIRQVPWLIIDIRYRLIWARYEENFNPSDDRLPIVFKFSEEAAQIVPTVNLPVLQEHDAVAGFLVRVQSFVSRDVEPIESCRHLVSSIFHRLSVADIELESGVSPCDLLMSKHFLNFTFRAGSCSISHPSSALLISAISLGS